jgi:hypothetical protein
LLIDNNRVPRTDMFHVSEDLAVDLLRASEHAEAKLFFQARVQRDLPRHRAGQVNLEGRRVHCGAPQDAFADIHVARVSVILTSMASGGSAASN